MVFMEQEGRAQTFYSAGSTAFPILSVGLGARAVGMGESYTAVADDLSAIHYNPAGLGQLKSPQLSLMHNSYLGSGFFESIGTAYPLGESGTLGLAFNYLNYGGIDKRDSLGNLQGTYTPFDISLVGAYGFKLDKDLFLGFSSQWIRQEINGVIHTGLLWDGGFLITPFDRLSAGVNFKNLGVDSGGYNLPTEIWTGAAYRLGLAPDDVHTLLFSLNGAWAFQGVSRLMLGFEYAIEKCYFLRAGYVQDLQNDPSSSLKGLDFGAGLKLGIVQMDYSFSFVGDLGNVHRFSLSIFFPSAEKAAAAAKAATTGNPIANSENSLAPPLTMPPNRPVMLKFQVKSQEDLTAQQFFDQAEEKLRLGLKQEALDLYLKAVDKDPNFQQAWMSLGKLYFDKSLETYRKVLEMDPKNDKLREWLGHFKQ